MRIVRLWVLFFLSAGFLIGLSTQAHSGRVLAEQVAEKSGKEGQIVSGHLDEAAKAYIIVDGQRYKLAPNAKIEFENDFLQGSSPTLAAGQFVQFTLDHNVANNIMIIMPR